MVSQHHHIVLVLLTIVVSIASITFSTLRFLRPSVSVHESYKAKLLVKSTSPHPLFFPRVAYFLEDGRKERVSYERKIIEQSLLSPIVNFEESYIDNVYNELFISQDKQKQTSAPYTNVCVPMASWQIETRPTCNSAHEIDILSGFIFDEEDKSRGFLSAKVVGKGGSRIVLKVAVTVRDLKDNSSSARDDAALKTLRIDREFEAINYEHQRVDAVASERLTPAPEVVDIYGYCGMTTIQELSSGLLLADLMKKAEIWNPLEVLELLLQASSSIASVHSTDYPSSSNASIVHNDIKSHNFIMSRSGVLKINDLNLAALLRWNITSSEKCGFLQRRFGGSEGVTVVSQKFFNLGIWQRYLDAQIYCMPYSFHRIPLQKCCLVMPLNYQKK